MCIMWLGDAITRAAFSGHHLLVASNIAATRYTGMKYLLLSNSNLSSGVPISHQPEGADDSAKRKRRNRLSCRANCALKHISHSYQHIAYAPQTTHRWRWQCAIATTHLSPGAGDKPYAVDVTTLATIMAQLNNVRTPLFSRAQNDALLALR